MNGSTVQMIKYMNRSVFPRTMYMNGVGFETLARTPVPKLSPSYLPPPLYSAIAEGRNLFEKAAAVLLKIIHQGHMFHKSNI